MLTCKNKRGQIILKILTCTYVPHVSVFERGGNRLKGEDNLSSTAATFLTYEGCSDIIETFTFTSLGKNINQWNFATK